MSIQYILYPFTFTKEMHFFLLINTRGTEDVFVAIATRV